MNHEIAQNHAATARRYGRCAGYAVRVDFLAYLREIAKERRQAPDAAAPGGRSRQIRQPAAPASQIP